MEEMESRGPEDIDITIIAPTLDRNTGKHRVPYNMLRKEGYMEVWGYYPVLRR